jgi:hypothetical protein
MKQLVLVVLILVMVVAIGYGIGSYLAEERRIEINHVYMTGKIVGSAETQKVYLAAFRGANLDSALAELDAILGMTMEEDCERINEEDSCSD